MPAPVPPSWSCSLFRLLTIFVCCLLFLTSRLSSIESMNNADAVVFELAQSESQNSIPTETEQKQDIYASLSSTADPQYLHSIPLAAISWINLGITPIVCLVGDSIEFQTETAKIFVNFLEQNNISHVFLRNQELPGYTVAQMCRIFAPLSRRLALTENSVVLTSDADYIPLKREKHWNNASHQMFIFNSQCCNQVNFRGLTFRMYPICTVAMQVKAWREVIGPQSIDLYEDGEAIEDVLLQHFNRAVFNNKGVLSGDTDKKAVSSWFVDQLLLSYWIHMWKERQTAPQIGEYKWAILRIDRSGWPSEEEIEKLNLSLYEDAHLPEGVLPSWSRTRPFFRKLLRQDLMDQLDQYVIDLKAAAAKEIAGDLKN